MSKPLPSPELLRKLLRYEPETGKLFWRERPESMFMDGWQTASTSAASWNSRYAGNMAMSARNNVGYLHGSIFYRSHKAHRVIWAMYHGEWPTDDIDHINGVKDDNRISNLRSVSHYENCRNQKKSRANTSGVTGVYWHKARRKWVSRIMVDGKHKNLGIFRSKSDAIKARKSAEVEHGFHANHGRTSTETDT